MIQIITTLIICVAVVTTAYIISHACVEVRVHHIGDAPQKDIDVEAIQKAIEDDKENVPNFADVIQAINHEFGGISNDENDAE